MNPADFPAALTGLVNSALAHGVNPMLIIGILDTVKGDVQQAVREKSKEQKIQPARMLPPNGR